MSCDEEKNHGSGRMQDETGQMISNRIHSPKNVVQSQCHPSKWLIMAHVEGRKHPANVGPAKAAEVRIFDDVFIVIPIDKFVLQYGVKGGDGEDNDDKRDSGLQKTA